MKDQFVLGQLGTIGNSAYYLVIRPMKNGLQYGNPGHLHYYLTQIQSNASISEKEDLNQQYLF